MSDAEWRAFLLTGTRTGKLGVTRPNGSPHVTPVWFLLDSSAGKDEVIGHIWSSSVKARALAREPRFSLCVDEQQPPYGYVMLTGHARLIDNPDQCRLWATRLGERYMGKELAPSYGKRNSVQGEYLVRGTVTDVIAITGITD
jgi:PPOX class probable F420-dependent enzyme